MKVGYSLNDKMSLFSMYMFNVECCMALCMNMLMGLKSDHCGFDLEYFTLNVSCVYDRGLAAMSSLSWPYLVSDDGSTFNH